MGDQLFQVFALLLQPLNRSIQFELLQPHLSEFGMPLRQLGSRILGVLQGSQQLLQVRMLQLQLSQPLLQTTKQTQATDLDLGRLKLMKITYS